MSAFTDPTVKDKAVYCVGNHRANIIISSRIRLKKHCTKDKEYNITNATLKPRLPTQFDECFIIYEFLVPAVVISPFSLRKGC